MCEQYNGWTNRETWALNLWLENDEGLYRATRECVAAQLEADENLHDYQDDKWLSENKRSLQTYVAGQAVKAFWEELTDPTEGLMTVDKILEMVRDVGSEYRVNWDEIGAAWLDRITEGE